MTQICGPGTPSVCVAPGSPPPHCPGLPPIPPATTILMDAWINRYGLNRFGDPYDTTYPTLDPCYNESKDVIFDYYNCLKFRHPDEPWQAEKDKCPPTVCSSICANYGVGKDGCRTCNCSTSHEDEDPSKKVSCVEGFI